MLLVLYNKRYIKLYTSGKYQYSDLQCTIELDSPDFKLNYPDFKLNYPDFNFTWFTSLWDNIFTVPKYNFTNHSITNDYIYEWLVKRITNKINSHTTSAIIDNDLGSHLPVINQTFASNLMWVIIILKFLNSSVGKSMLALMIILLVNWLSNLNIYNALNYIINILNFGSLLDKRDLNSKVILYLLSWLGNLGYFVFFSFYDYMSYVMYVQKKHVIKHKILDKISLKALYSVSIILGVFGSNGVWFLSNTWAMFSNYRVCITIATGISSIVFYFLWFILGNACISNSRINIMINSVFRAICEVIAFNSIAWNNYSLWNYYTGIFDNMNLSYGLSIGVGSVLHLIFTYLCIYIETDRVYHILYGISNYLSFTSVAFATNGIFAFVVGVSTGVRVIIIVITFFTTSLLNPVVYRHETVYNNSDIELSPSNNTTLDRTRTNITRNVLINTFRYFMVVVSFVILTGLIYSYV